MNLSSATRSASLRPLEVDIARLLLILDRFAWEPDDSVRQLRCWPDHEISRVFTPEYHLQKLDFLVRYPAYLAYELADLHRTGVPSAADGEAVKRDIRLVLAEGEPEMRTLPFRRFLRGAYESLDSVKNWWHSHRLVFVRSEPRGAAGSPGRPQTYFFLTPLGEDIAEGLVREVEHARWYADRIQLIYRYYGALSASEVVRLQYSHAEYRDAQLNQFIPDLTLDQIRSNFTRTFDEELEVDHA